MKMSPYSAFVPVSTAHTGGGLAAAHCHSPSRQMGLLSKVSLGVIFLVFFCPSG